MENMPYRDSMAVATSTITTAQDLDWQSGLPIKVGGKVSVRELRLSDAQALFAMLSTDEVARFISPPPTTLEGFEWFIVWTHRERQEGRYACFAVVPHGCDHAVGIFQIRQLDFNFETAEWGFALGAEYWGTGVFVDAAREVLDFVFGTLNVHRLEARSALGNGRGNSAILNLGAVHEGVMRKSFLRNGKYHDQNMWSILDEDWYTARQLLPR
jgi:RimJ/RimL family protein N-acetyltransferase